MATVLFGSIKLSQGLVFLYQLITFKVSNSKGRNDTTLKNCRFLRFQFATSKNCQFLALFIRERLINYRCMLTKPTF